MVEKRCFLKHSNEHVVNSSVSVFADDTRITKVVKDEKDAKELQAYLESQYEWARE